MLPSKRNISALALAVATSQALPTQQAYAQSTTQQSGQSANEIFCRTQAPRDLSSYSTLRVHLSSCMQAWNATKKPDVAWYASWSQLRMAMHHYNYQKTAQVDYVANAAFLAKAAKNGGYDIKTLWDAGTELEKLKATHEQKYGTPKSEAGTDNSIEAKCIHERPPQRSVALVYKNWMNFCATAYNQNKNPFLARYYAAGAAIWSAESYSKGEFAEAERLLTESKRFESYADINGWSDSGIKEAIAELDKVQSNRQLALRQQEAQRQAAAAQQEQERQRQIAQEQPKGGLSNSDKAALAIGGALLLALIFGSSSSSKSSGSGSGSSSSANDAIEFERQQQRQREMSKQQPPSQPEPRSYGFYGNCPAPGMGYGC